MQVASRFLLVWGVVDTFPAVAQSSFAYSTMLLAWSATEVIRYSYFAVNIAYGKVPAALTWLRYNTFFVLYPMGISSECWLIWLATGPARRKFGGVGQWGLWAVLGVYVPGKFCLRTLKLLESVVLTGCRVLYSVYPHDGAETEGHARLGCEEVEMR